MGATLQSFHLMGFATVLKREGAPTANAVVIATWFTPNDDVTTTKLEQF